MRTLTSTNRAARRALALLLLLASLVATNLAEPAQSWSGYIPDKQRKEIFKKARKREVTADGLIGGSIIDTIWVTRDVARAAVSQRMDDERITNEEADRLLAAYRTSDRYYVHVRYSTLPGGPEINEKGLFLQRASSSQVFSRATYEKGLVFDSGIKTTVEDETVILAFPKKSEGGEAIVRSLDDKIEISIKTQFKRPSVTIYSVKDLVKDVKDL